MLFFSQSYSEISSFKVRSLFSPAISPIILPVPLSFSVPRPLLKGVFLRLLISYMCVSPLDPSQFLLNSYQLLMLLTPLSPSPPFSHSFHTNTSLASITPYYLGFLMPLCVLLMSYIYSFFLYLKVGDPWESAQVLFLFLSDNSLGSLIHFLDFLLPISQQFSNLQLHTSLSYRLIYVQLFST